LDCCKFIIMLTTNQIISKYGKKNYDWMHFEIGS
jgi:hypothetical protein